MFTVDNLACCTIDEEIWKGRSTVLQRINRFMQPEAKGHLYAA